MQNLALYDNQHSDVQISAEVNRSGAEFEIKFQVSDPEQRLHLPENFLQSNVPRQDELWKETCFEMFLKPDGGDRYYEFNFSLVPAWNQYVFTEYRNPQPPVRSEDFELSRFAWHNLILTVVLKAPKELLSCHIGLTAVMKQKNGKVDYRALKHAGMRPDFHLSESFVIKR